VGAAMAVLSFFILLFISAVISQNCSWKDPNSGNQYNLSRLVLEEGFYQAEDSLYTWELNVCHTVPTLQCQEDLGTLCQYDGGTFVSAWATWGRDDQVAAYPTWSLADPENPAGGVQLNFTNGVPSCYYQGRKYDRASVIKFVCRPGQGTTTNFSILQLDPCTYEVTFESEHACPLGMEDLPAKSLSAGSILLIAVAIFIPVYILVGCIYKTKRHDTKGTDSCPNVEFWRDLPALVRDGCRFTFRGCKKGTGNAYEEL
jgi:hypothetical protein